MTDIFEKVTEGIKGIEERLGAKYDDLDKRFDSAMTEIGQKMTGYKSGMGLNGMGTDTKTDLANEAFEKFEAKRADFTQNRTLRVEVKAASIIDTNTVSTISELGQGQPSLYPYGFQHALTTVAAPGLDIAHYSRYKAADDQGAAAVVPEKSEKPLVSPTYLDVSQKSATVACLLRVSEQALSSAAGMKTAISGVMAKSLAKALDGYLVNGATDPKWDGFKTLAVPHVSTYKELVDAISDGVDAMNRKGCTPTGVVLNPSDWVALICAQNTLGDYKSGAYLEDISTRTLRGLPISLSESVAVGSAYLVDGNNVELRYADQAALQFGYVNSDWSSNTVTARLELRAAPILYVDHGIYLVTPAKA